MSLVNCHRNSKRIIPVSKFLRGLNMSVRGESIFAIAIAAVVLLIAFKFGEIGGGGGGASRDKNPFLFWLGVGITSFFALVAIGVFISTFMH